MNAPSVDRKPLGFLPRAKPTLPQLIATAEKSSSEFGELKKQARQNPEFFPLVGSKAFSTAQALFDCALQYPVNSFNRFQFLKRGIQTLELYTDKNPLGTGSYNERQTLAAMFLEEAYLYLQKLDPNHNARTNELPNISKAMIRFLSENKNSRAALFIDREIREGLELEAEFGKTYLHTKSNLQTLWARLTPETAWVGALIQKFQDVPGIVRVVNRLARVSLNQPEQFLQEALQLKVAAKLLELFPEDLQIRAFNYPIAANKQTGLQENTVSDIDLVVWVKKESRVNQELSFQKGIHLIGCYKENPNRLPGTNEWYRKEASKIGAQMDLYTRFIASFDSSVRSSMIRYPLVGSDTIESAVKILQQSGKPASVPIQCNTSLSATLECPQKPPIDKIKEWLRARAKDGEIFNVIP